MNPHQDWATVLSCEAETLSDPRVTSFQRIITHAQAAAMIEGYARRLA
ncbi:hypothetical protein [Methylobacterium indicum]|nr:hypothetical protein [Methylobacterium indicum]